jgi:hypothetical protein
MRRLGLFLILGILAAITAPFVLFIALFRDNIQQVEEWGRSHLPWWDFCNGIEQELGFGPQPVKE